MNSEWTRFCTYRGIQILRLGTPATGQEYRIDGQHKTYACLTCCKREADRLADRVNRICLDEPVL
jgi:hypothetical protein